ncbi:MAG: NERD domain-containing protein [Anaerolineae bacterium]
MVCVDNSITDVVAGYDRIRQGEKKAGERHAFRQKVAQQQQEQRARAEQLAWEARRRRLTPLIAVGAAAVIVTVALIGLAGLLVLRFWLAPNAPSAPWLGTGYGLIVGALVFFGILVVALALGAWVRLVGRRPVSSAPTAPATAGPLLPRWRSAMSTTLPPPAAVVQQDNPLTWGYPGEYDLVSHLLDLPSNDPFPAYLLYSVRPRHGDDLDCVVVGRRGICLFEVKYWSGRVTWRGGRWEHVDIDRKTGVEKATDHKQWPDEQWLRMADELRLTLERRAPDVVARYPRIAEIQGGIVFAHPDAVLQIGSGIPVFAGRVEDWMVFYERIQGPVSLDERAALQVVEALLSRHNQVVGEEVGGRVVRHSMLDEADRLIASAMA